MATVGTIGSTIGTMTHHYHCATNPFSHTDASTIVVNPYFGYVGHVQIGRITSGTYYEIRLIVTSAAGAVITDTTQVEYTERKYSYYPTCLWVSPDELLIIWSVRSVATKCVIWNQSTTSLGTIQTIYAKTSTYASISFSDIIMDSSGDIHFTAGYRDSTSETHYYYHKAGDGWGTWTQKIWNSASTPACGGLSTNNSSALCIREDQIWIGMISIEASNIAKLKIIHKDLDADPSSGWPASWTYSSAELPYNAHSTYKWTANNLHCMVTAKGSIYWAMRKVYRNTGSSTWYTLLAAKTLFTTGGVYSSTSESALRIITSTGDTENASSLVLTQSGEDDCTVVFTESPTRTGNDLIREVSLTGVSWGSVATLASSAGNELNQMAKENQHNMLSGHMQGTTRLDWDNYLFWYMHYANGSTTRYLGKCTFSAAGESNRQMPNTYGIPNVIALDVGSTDYSLDSAGFWDMIGKDIDINLINVPKITGLWGYPTWVVFALFDDGKGGLAGGKYYPVWGDQIDKTDFILLGAASITGSVLLTTVATGNHDVSAYFFDALMRPIVDPTTGELLHYTETNKVV